MIGQPSNLDDCLGCIGRTNGFLDKIGSHRREFRLKRPDGVLLEIGG